MNMARMNMRNLLVGADVWQVQDALKMAVEDGDADRIGYIDEWVRELWNEYVEEYGYTAGVGCESGPFSAYRVTFIDVKGYEGVDYFDHLTGAMLCMMCHAKDVRDGRIEVVDLQGSYEPGSWWYCITHNGGRV